MAKYWLTMASEADLMLRRYIVELADKVIASKVYSGPEFDLSIFLAGHVYQCTPADIREHQAELEAAVKTPPDPSALRGGSETPEPLNTRS